MQFSWPAVQRDAARGQIAAAEVGVACCCMVRKFFDNAMLLWCALPEKFFGVPPTSTNLHVRAHAPVTLPFLLLISQQLSHATVDRSTDATGDAGDPVICTTRMHAPGFLVICTTIRARVTQNNTSVSASVMQSLLYNKIRREPELDSAIERGREGGREGRPRGARTGCGHYSSVCPNQANFGTFSARRTSARGA
jgi:hypothetical protein